MRSKKKYTIFFGFNGKNFDKFLNIVKETLIDNIECKPGDTLKLEFIFEQEVLNNGHK